MAQRARAPNFEKFRCKVILFSLYRCPSLLVRVPLNDCSPYSLNASYVTWSKYGLKCDIDVRVSGGVGSHNPQPSVISSVRLD